MDWIPRPAEVAKPLPEVPCLSIDEDYDHGEWKSYPERQGYHVRTISEWAHFMAAPPSGFDAFLEKWLFWAALEVMMGHGVKLKIRDFVARSEDGQYRIVFDKTIIIRLFPAGFRFHRFGTSFDIHESFMKRQTVDLRGTIGTYHRLRSEPSVNSLMSLFAFCKNFDDSFTDPRGKALIQLTCFLHEASPHGRAIIDEFDDKYRAGYDLLARSGWCRPVARMMSAKFSASACAYISQLRRPDPDRDHSLWCTHTRCLWQKSNNKKYFTHHVEDCSGCVDLIIDKGAMASALRKNEIPLLTIINGYRGPFLQVNCCTPTDPVKYIAFSHVWSDGLGNTKHNALPYCQIKRLEYYVSKVSAGLEGGATHYWLDTLCVPPDEIAKGDDDEAELQTLATHKLYETYAAADSVVVIDKWVTQTVDVDHPHLQIFATINSSPWSSRLWTFQEGLLAKPGRLFFVVKGQKLLNADATHSLFNGSAKRPHEASLIYRMLERYTDLRHMALQGRLDHTERVAVENPPRGIKFVSAPDGVQFVPVADARTHLFFVRVMTALRFRSTSMASDEALCLAVLFDVDVRSIAERLARTRIAHFWSMLSWIPMSVLFWDSPWCTQVGLRWAPMTLLSSDDSFGTSRGLMRTCLKFIGNRLGRVTSDGVKLPAPGVIFEISRKTLCEEAFYIRYRNLTLVVRAQTRSSQTIRNRRASIHAQVGPFFALIWLTADDEGFEITEGCANPPIQGALLVAIEYVTVFPPTAYTGRFVEGVLVDTRCEDHALLEAKACSVAKDIISGQELTASTTWYID